MADGRRVTTGSVFPYRLTNATKQNVIDMFDAAGSSVHSNLAVVLGVVVEHCIANDIDFTLTRVTTGYYIERINK